MKIKMKQTIEAPLDIVLRAREERFNHIDKIDGLRNPNFTERTEDNKKITTKRMFDIAMDKTPASLKKMFAPDMFRFEETAVWDKKKNLHTWEMVPRAQKNKIEWKGETVYAAKGDATERTIECIIRVQVPIIGDVIEKLIGEGYKKSQEKDLRTIAAMAKLIVDGKV